MTKPPFQFGLKAVFIAMTGAATLAAFAAPEETVEALAALAVLTAFAAAAVLALGTLIVFGLSISMAIYHAIRLLGRPRIAEPVLPPSSRRALQ
jgi:hypothetical protein